MPVKSENKNNKVTLAFLVTLLTYALGIAIVMTALLLFFFNGQDASFEAGHLVIFVILFGALSYGANSKRHRVDYGINLRSAFINQVVLLSGIIVFMMAINGLLSLFDYFSILDNLYLPPGSVSHYAVHVLLVLCSLLLFGVFTIALLMTVIPKEKTKD